MSNKRKEFWLWFEINQTALTPRHITRALIEAVEARIQDAVGDVAWEIGPLGDGSQCFLAVSPTSEDPAVNEAAKLLIDGAPSLPSWSFRAFKPPRDWELYFELNVNGEMRSVDGTQWEVVVVNVHDQWDVIFRADESCVAFPPSSLRSAAFTILDGELGGEDRRRLVWDTDVVASWNEFQKGKALKLEVGLLRKLLSS